MAAAAAAARGAAAAVAAAATAATAAMAATAEAAATAPVAPAAGGGARRTLRVGTLNVHMFVDGSRGEHAVAALARLIKRADVDIIGLQEVTGEVVTDDAGTATPALDALAAACCLPHVTRCLPTFLGNAVLSRVPLAGSTNVVLRHADDHKRCLIAGTATAPDGTPFTFATTHLNHQREPTRLQQWRTVADTLAGASPVLLVGDFNALTASDYTDAEWRRIAAVRADGRWEAPHTDLTAAVRAAGYVDYGAAARAASPSLFTGALSTCAYHTRIDYIWGSPAFAASWRLVRYGHIATTATDHALVVAEFEPTGTPAVPSHGDT